MIQHYVLGIDFDGIEQHIVHRQPSIKGGPDRFDYSFEKQEARSGLSAKKPVAYFMIENAEEMLKELKKPEMAPFLSKAILDNLELIEILPSTVSQVSSAMLDYKG